MVTEQGRTEAQETTGKAMKRRGILAAAGAVVAGMVAKGTRTTVEATTGGGTQGVLALGSNAFSNSPNTSTIYTALDAGPGFLSDYVLVVDASANADTGPAGVGGIFGAGRRSGFGVFGVTNFSASVPDGFPALKSGIYGYAQAGVGNGVTGNSSLGTGVLGQSTSGTGTQGEITGGSATNTRAVVGLNDSTGTNGIGVYGQCAAVGGYGVVGTAATPSSIGIGGMAYADGSSAFSGGTSNPLAYAGYFQGQVVVAGSFDVSPLGNKHGVAPHPDGTHRTFYSVESPECWVEDFGTGTLVGGKAEVALDADFAALTHTDQYHVFFTEHGGHHGLHMTTKDATGFTVEADGELAKLKGKKGSDLAGTFSYRVVAKPKTTAKVGRLAKATLPNLPLPPLPQTEPPKKA